MNRPRKNRNAELAKIVTDYLTEPQGGAPLLTLDDLGLLAEDEKEVVKFELFERGPKTTFVEMAKALSKRRGTAVMNSKRGLLTLIRVARLREAGRNGKLSAHLPDEYRDYITKRFLNTPGISIEAAAEAEGQTIVTTLRTERAILTDVLSRAGIALD